MVHLFLPARTAPRPVGEETRLGQAVQRAPRSWAAHQALGRYYLDHGQTFEAIWELGAAHRLAPREPTVSLQLAVALSSGLMYDQAITPLEELAAQRPPLREGRVQLATLCLGTMQPEKALAALREAPDAAHWADGQLALGQVDEALGKMSGQGRNQDHSTPGPVGRGAMARLRVVGGAVMDVKEILQKSCNLLWRSKRILKTRGNGRCPMLHCSLLCLDAGRRHRS